MESCESTNRHYDRMMMALYSLADSGKVQGGASVYLETVPMPFLQAAPLVEGEWLDRYVVGLAELGARLEVQGYQVQEAGVLPNGLQTHFAVLRHCGLVRAYKDNDTIYLTTFDQE